MKIMNQDEISRLLYKLSQSFLGQKKDLSNVRIVGIQRRGSILASRVSKIIGELRNKSLPVGTLDITLYRDDLSRISHHPVIRNTNIPFSIDEKHILLVDDVLYSGRTVRAAIDALLDMGRPRKVELLVLVDRNHRELPIQADYVGKEVMILPHQMVEVRVNEIDGEEAVLIMERGKNGV